MSNWTADDIPNQTGRVVIITGANSGIGYEAANVLADKGARVILAVRNQNKGELAKTNILSEHPEAQVSVRLVDMASLKSIKAFADGMLKELSQLDLLINNAGIMVPPYSKTEDGFESQMGTNHMGHFALTAQLFPLLNKTEGSRIVNVSSNAHNMGNINFDDLHWETRKYSPWKAYGDSKIANLYFTYELDRKLRAQGANTMVTAAHPGYSATGLQKSAVWKLLNMLIAQSALMGALPTLRAATDPDARSGNYFGPTGMAGWRGYPKRVSSNQQSHDETAAQKLWSVSEELTHEKVII